MNFAKIVTRYVYPPIPRREFDWCAHYDDEEGLVGWGATEAAAVSDLQRLWEEWVECSEEEARREAEERMVHAYGARANRL